MVIMKSINCKYKHQKHHHHWHSEVESIFHQVKMRFIVFASLLSLAVCSQFDSYSQYLVFAAKNHIKSVSQYAETIGFSQLDAQWEQFKVIRSPLEFVHHIYFYIISSNNLSATLRHQKKRNHENSIFWRIFSSLNLTTNSTRMESCPTMSESISSPIGFVLYIWVTSTRI